ncbi:putative inactive poly [ADP-ribose] polymerase SRO1 [Sesamum angolense]|uniref:Inactive poly [ADP-ribose] polymerase SRO1 n=1 Tax=Sesamum angolense TaxID=2727404 RepID=A0AAE2BS29_9LAMI|nr:putative inactive poly [ADP-ribose] polymerase SRO1 [Sesamum angolense]
MSFPLMEHFKGASSLLSVPPTSWFLCNRLPVRPSTILPSGGNWMDLKPSIALVLFLLGNFCLNDIVTFINKDLVKKPVVEVEVNGSKTLLNFLHMLQLGMDSGLHQPIAWIDVSGKCFFPEIVTDDELYGCRDGAESQRCNDINVRLEIESHELYDEPSGESNAILEQARSHDNAANHCEHEINS